jgi:tetratricopeptide (TPR) repeat protein
VAFLIGTGFFDRRGFVVRQYFMRDYDEEPAMLRELNLLLKSFEGLVTFNGRSFDWNILSSRFIFNRIKPALPNPVNLDLLFPARRIWSLKLESCSLSSLEENILGEIRTGDIPGALIPQIYFRYLEDGCTDEIKKVIKHNESDILSMVSLLVKMADMIENPRLDCPGYELYGIGRILESEPGSSSHIMCYEACAETDIYTVKAAAAKRLAGIYKKKGDYENALRHWQEMAENSAAFDLEPMIEMAKYYEHKAKDISKAAEIVDRAIQSAVRRGMTGGRIFADLKKRRDRLKRKAEMKLDRLFFRNSGI